MTKAELISVIADETRLTKAQASDALKAAIGAIKSALQLGDKVVIAGFGAFSTVTKAPRKGVNPRSGEAIEIPETKAVKFKAGKELSSVVK